MADQNTASDGGLGDFLKSEMGAEFDSFVSGRGQVPAAPTAPTGNRFAPTQPEPVAQTQQTATVTPPPGQPGVATTAQETTTTTQTPTGEQTTTDTTQDASLKLPSPSAQANMLGLDTQDSKDRRRTIIQGMFDKGDIDRETATSILDAPLDEKPTAQNLGLLSEAPEEATVGGAIKETGKVIFDGIKGLFSGEVIGEALGAKLVEKNKIPELQKAQNALQRKLIENHPEQAEMIKTLKDPADLLQFPDTAELVADVGLVALDLLTLGKGKAVTAGVKLAAKEALKRGGKKGLAAFFKQQLPAMLKTVGKEVGSGAAIGAGFGGGQAVKDGGGVGEALGGAALGAALGGAIPLAGKILGGVGKKIFANKKVKIGGGTHAELAMPKLTRKEAAKLAKEGNIKYNKKGEVVSVELPERLKATEKLLKSEKINSKDKGAAVKQLTDKIGDEAEALKKELVKVPFNKQAATGANTKSRAVLKEMSDSAEFGEFSTSLKKGQDQFEKIVGEVKDKTNPTANDWWEVRKKYDKVIDARVKEYAGEDINKAAALQDQWLQNRQVLNELLDIQTQGKQALPVFKKMNQFYNARENIITTLGTKLEKGWLQRNQFALKVVGGIVGLGGVGTTLLRD